MTQLAPTDIEFRHFHLFCGLGGGAKGFNKGKARVGSLNARFRCIGGVDVDPASVRDFTRAAGVNGTVLDMFSREQYVAFHRHEPPAGWRECTSIDIQRAAHGERPHIVFLSAPCKGFSGLLPEASSATAKYQALNGLTFRGVWLMLDAWSDDPPELIVFENVPRIASRGRDLLDHIIALLRSYGYAVRETTHDCGELGGLGQSRKRFLLVARHEKKVPPFLYEPEKRRLRGVGEILEKLPMPGDGRGGSMHRMPALQWKTWVRLAFVEAGSDWRSLNKLAVENGMLRDFGIVPGREWHDDILGVLPWSETARTVTGNAGATTGRFSVADPRTFAGSHNGIYGVHDWAEPSGVVTSNGRPASGSFSVADPRFESGGGGSGYQQFGVRAWDETAGAVINVKSPGQGTFSVADPRLEGRPRFNNTFRIVPWGEASPAIAGPGGPAGGLAVADPRPAERTDYKQTKYRVTGYDEPAGTVIAASSTGNGGYAVADPRTGWGDGAHQNLLVVTDWEKPAKTITGATHVAGAALSVADPRPANELRNGVHGVAPWDESTGTVAGESLPSNGAFSVADPRAHNLGHTTTNYRDTSGHYGVIPWDATSRAVLGSGKYDNGPWSVADPREVAPEPMIALPAPTDRLVAVIRALDGTWHRPFTTLELAALQSLFDPDEDFQLDGLSDSAWRERIGNAVPPEAAAAIAGVMGTTLLLAMTGETFMLSSQPIWVRPVALALAVDDRENVYE